MGAPQYEQAGADVSGSGTVGTIPVWSGTGTTLGNSLLSQSGGNAVRLNGITFFAGTSGAGTGGNYRITDDSGADKWLMGLLGTAGARTWTLYDIVNTQTRIAVDGTTGSVGIGTASLTAKLEVPASASLAGVRVQLAALPKNNYYNAEYHYFRNLADQNVVAVDSVAKTLDVSLQSGWGLKLPATPGSGDAQTLDAYNEAPLASTAGNGWTPTIGGTAAQWGGTLPTVSFARYVQIGSIVFCDVRLTSANIQSTYGLTTITPPPPAQNAFATEVVVPASTTAGGVTGNGAQFGGVVYLPTLAASTAIRLTWFYFTTS